MEDLLHLIYLLLIVLIITIFYSSFPKKNNSLEQIDSTQNSFCGTISFPVPNNVKISETLSPEIGKKIFKNHCATCHHKNMVSDGFGPALNNSIKRWENDTLKYSKYIANSETYMKEHLDLRLINLRNKFESRGNPHEYNFDKDEITSLLIYIDAISNR